MRGGGGCGDRALYSIDGAWRPIVSICRKGWLQCITQYDFSRNFLFWFRKFLLPIRNFCSKKVTTKIKPTFEIKQKILCNTLQSDLSINRHNWSERWTITHYASFQIESTSRILIMKNSYCLFCSWKRPKTSWNHLYVVGCLTCK